MVRKNQAARRIAFWCSCLLDERQPARRLRTDHRCSKRQTTGNGYFRGITGDENGPQIGLRARSSAGEGAVTYDRTSRRQTASDKSSAAGEYPSPRVPG